MKTLETMKRNRGRTLWPELLLGLLLGLLASPSLLLAAQSATASPLPELGDCNLSSIGLLDTPVTFEVQEYQGEVYEGGLVHLRHKVVDSWVNVIGEVTTSGSGGWRVSEMALYQDKLAIGGNEIDAVDGLTVNNVMTWNGTIIEALGSGFDDEVTALVGWGSHLVAGGLFVTSGDGTQTFNGIALWDGSTWQALDGGMSGTGTQGAPVRVLDLAVFQGELWATGVFEFADTELVNGLARWDGTSWHGVGGLTDLTGNLGPGTALAVHQGKLYVSGFYADVAGSGIGSMAAWDGSSWQAIGYDAEDASGPIRGADAMISTGDRLVAVGFEVLFLNPGTFYDLGYWDGTEWHGVATGPNGLWDAAASSTDPSRWYIGGEFVNIFDPIANVFEVGCPALGIPVFADDFETGDFSGWSLTVP